VSGSCDYGNEAFGSIIAGNLLTSGESPTLPKKGPATYEVLPKSSGNLPIKKIAYHNS
jgi:hypothetical protein